MNSNKPIEYMTISDADMQYLLYKTYIFIATYPLDPSLSYAYDRLM